MKKITFSFILAASAVFPGAAAAPDASTGATIDAGALQTSSADCKQKQCGFCRNFNDSTLRIDYIFGGGPSGTHIMVDRQSKIKGWAGRRARLNEVPYLGNGTIMVVDPQTSDTLYRNSFSSLFQEWIHSPEAQTIEYSFQNSFLDGSIP